jgi:hypothetical protein
VVPDRGLTKSNEIRRGVEGRKADLAVVVVHVPVARWRGRYQTMWQRTVLCGVMVGARMVVGWRETAWWARVLLEFEETLAHQTMMTARLAGGGGRGGTWLDVEGTEKVWVLGGKATLSVI